MTVATALVVGGHSLTRDERRLAHAALLAQVDDVHSGGVYMWGEVEFAGAVALLSRLTGEEVGVDAVTGPPRGFGMDLSSRVLTMALLVPVYDLDHPDMAVDEWGEAERLLVLLASEFGR